MNKVNLILIIFTMALVSCVGTVKDKNPRLTKAADVGDQPIAFSGITSATPVSNSKVSLSFVPAPGNPKDLTYLIYVNNSITAIEIKGEGLTPGPSGQLTYTVKGLLVNTNYAFSVGVRNALDGSESNENKTVYAKTFANFTADFSGVSGVEPSAGDAGQTEVQVEWVPAVTIGSSFNPKPLDPVGYEIRYMSSNSGSPSDLYDTTLPQVFVEPVPSPIDPGKLSEDRSAPVSGLSPGTQYYFMVRAIHKDYYTYNGDPNYKREENIKIMSVTTVDAGGFLDWDNQSVNVEPTKGEDGLNKVDVTWDEADGPFFNYRVYAVKIADDDVDTLADVPCFSTSCDFDDAEFASLNGDGDYFAVNADEIFYKVTNLEEFAWYKFTTVVCATISCDNANRIPGRTVTHRVVPLLAPFSGVIDIRDPGSTSEYEQSVAGFFDKTAGNDGNDDGIDDAGEEGQSIETITVRFDAPIVSAGYLNKLQLYCIPYIDGLGPDSDINNYVPLEYDVTTDKDGDAGEAVGCRGFKRITDNPSNVSSLGAFTEIKVSGDFVDAGDDISSQQYCFAVIPVIVKPDGNEISHPENAIIKCKKIEIKVPSLSEFPGAEANCQANVDELKVEWELPTNGLYNNFKIFYKEVDGNGFRFDDAIAGAAGYSEVDVPGDSAVEADITGLTPGKIYSYGILSYLDGTPELYSEANTGIVNCQLPFPEPTFREWVDIFAIGPKVDGLVPRADTTGKERTMFETLSSDGEVIEVFVDSDNDPTDEFVNQFFDIDSNLKIDGIYGKPDGDPNEGTSYQYSNSGIIRIAWKDVTFLGGTVPFEDYINDAGELNSIDKTSREFGYRVYRSDDGGSTWKNLTAGGVNKDPFQKTNNAGLIHPVSFSERPRINEPVIANVKVGQFTDYSVKALESNSEKDRARVYFYKIVPVFNNTELVYERAGTNPQHIIKVTLPPKNMGLVHRLMANRQTCMELGKEYSTDIRENYRCNWNGLGASGQSKPWVVGSTVYDFGGDLLMDRYEMGCNFTRGHQGNEDSEFTSSRFDFKGLSDGGNQFRGCLLGIGSSSPMQNNGGNTDPWENEHMFRPGDCIWSGRNEIAQKACVNPAQVVRVPIILPGITTDLDACNVDEYLDNGFLDPYKGSTSKYAEIAQSEWMAVLYHDYANTLNYQTQNGWKHRGNGGNAGSTANHINIDRSNRVSKCMINIPVRDTSIGGDGDDRLKPRWLSVNQLDVLNHANDSDINLLDKTVSEIKAMTTTLFDTGINSLPEPNFMNSYNLRYVDDRPIAKVFSSNNAKLPPLTSMDQTQAEVVCDAYQVEVGYSEDGTSGNFNSSGGTYNKRLMRRGEGIVANAHPRSYNETKALEVEDGSVIVNGAESNYRPGCNVYDRDVNGSNPSRAAGTYISSRMTDTLSGAERRPAFITGSSMYDGYDTSNGNLPSASFNTQSCISRYGMQDLIGNVTEYSSERIFCDFAGEVHYIGVDGDDSGSIEMSTLRSEMNNFDASLGDFFNTDNMEPWVQSSPDTGRCSVVEFGSTRGSIPTNAGVMKPVQDIFGNINTDIIGTPVFKDSYYHGTLRNGDGYFLDFGQGVLAPPLSKNDTLALADFSNGEPSYSRMFGRSEDGSDPRVGYYFNPILGLPLSCAGTSCDSSTDNRTITTSIFVDKYVIDPIPPDMVASDFPIGKSNILSDGMSEISVGTSYSLPNGTEKLHTFVDQIFVDGDNPDHDPMEAVGAGPPPNEPAHIDLEIDVASDGPVYEISTSNFILRRNSANEYGVFFENFAGAQEHIRSGRYSANVVQNGVENQRSINNQTGFRCVIKINEDKY